MSFFMEKIFQGHKAAITQAILNQIRQDREGNAINKEVVKKSIQIFVDMGLIKPKPMKTRDGIFLWQGDRNLSVYDDHFERDFLI